jgi:hypothetical protein
MLLTAGRAGRWPPEAKRVMLRRARKKNEERFIDVLALAAVAAGGCDCDDCDLAAAACCSAC